MTTFYFLVDYLDRHGKSARKRLAKRESFNNAEDALYDVKRVHFFGATDRVDVTQITEAQYRALRATAPAL